MVASRGRAAEVRARRAACLLTVALFASLASSVHAADDQARSVVDVNSTDVPSPAPSEESSPPGGTKAILRGALLSMTISPRTDIQYAQVASGYDGARKDLVYQGVVDAHVYGGFSARAGFASHDLSNRASALLGARWQFLGQERHSVDLALGLFYAPQDIEGEGQIIGTLSAARRFGRLDLLAHVGYGQDPEGDDSVGQGGLAALYRASDAFAFGIDGRMRALLMTSDEKHIGMFEPKWDLAAGPLFAFSVGPVALSALVGMSAQSIRGGHVPSELKLGPLALLGVTCAL